MFQGILIVTTGNKGFVIDKDKVEIHQKKIHEVEDLGGKKIRRIILNMEKK